MEGSSFMSSIKFNALYYRIRVNSIRFEKSNGECNLEDKINSRM